MLNRIKKTIAVFKKQDAKSVEIDAVVGLPDKRLEDLSDKARSGIPISINEGLEVIAYQEQLRKKRESSIWRRFIHWLAN